jgi:hypothetical protein
MKREQLLDGRAWFDRGREAWWKLFPRGTTDPVTLTWPIPAGRAGEVRMRFPRPATVRGANRREMARQIRIAFEQFVQIEEAEVPQLYDKTVSLEAVVRGKTFKVNFETSDYAPLNEEAYAGCDLHFKMEYALEGYGERDHLLPGGYVNSSPLLYTYLPRLRRIRDEEPPTWEVYGRYGLSLEKRKRPIEILRAATRFRYHGGVGKARYIRYLEESARSKICIDLPSMSSITYRMIELLAIGSCIVGPPHTNRLLMPFQEGVHVTYCRPDYSDLEDVCAALLADEPRRLALVANSRAFFDAYVHRRQQGSYYVAKLLERFG